MPRKIILCAGQSGRALVYGTVDSEPVPGQPVRLTDARMILYYPRECGGVFGLAAKGPRPGVRITHAVDETVETAWQEWLSVSDEAAQAIDAMDPYCG